jgi:hypothetical protein
MPAEDLPDSPEYVPPGGIDAGEGRPSERSERRDRNRTGSESTGSY